MFENHKVSLLSLAREGKLRAPIALLLNVLYRFLRLLPALLAGFVVSCLLVERERFFLSGSADSWSDIFGDPWICVVLFAAASYLVSFVWRKRSLLYCNGFMAALMRILMKGFCVVGCVALFAVVVSVWRVLDYGMYTHPLLREYGLCLEGGGQRDYYYYDVVNCGDRHFVEKLFITAAGQFDLNPPARLKYSFDGEKLKIDIRELDGYDSGVTWTFDPRSRALLRVRGSDAF